ncbi:hypothetical protein BV25DRAFT_1922387 [Artomyces pyxidatus]|uniref:Uncharacterized protein n=1 Tax=Artomyces pyxidatus TaxID=48021 RepID=A0ACB8SFH3_9AGAM|nr:hypothetical protein BV25DRAFT_1922387 [Artomyces pyxidatus]
MTRDNSSPHASDNNPAPPASQQEAQPQVEYPLEATEALNNKVPVKTVTSPPTAMEIDPPAAPYWLFDPDSRVIRYINCNCDRKHKEHANAAAKECDASWRLAVTA